MKNVFLFLLLPVYCLRAMQEEPVELLKEVELTSDAAEYIKKFVLTQNRKKRFLATDAYYLSNNHTQFLDVGLDNKNVLNIVFVPSLAKRRLELHYLITKQDGKKGMATVLHSNDVDKLQGSFDGPNDTNIVVTNDGYFVLDLDSDQISRLEAIYSGVRKKEIGCWCRCAFSRGHMYDECPSLYCRHDEYIDSKVESVYVTAVHKTTNHFALVGQSGAEHLLMIYRLCDDGYKPQKVAHRAFSLAANVTIKRLSFLTGRNLLALDSEGTLYLVALDEKEKKIAFLAQKIWDSYKQEIVDMPRKTLKVNDIAVDSCNPTQMIMLLENGKLVHGDILNHTYMPLVANKKISSLRYCNDKACIEKENGLLYMFDVYPIKQNMIKQLAIKS